MYIFVKSGVDCVFYSKQSDLNSVSVLSSCYSLWTDEANCLRSYLDAHTKGNSKNSKMDNQLWKHSHISCWTINKYTPYGDKKKVLPWLLTASLTPLLSLSLSLTLRVNGCSMHSCALTGIASESHRTLRGWFRWAAAGVLLQIWIQPGMFSLCVCELSLLQSNQEEIVFEVLVIWSPAALVEVKGLTPTGICTHCNVT